MTEMKPIKFASTAVLLLLLGITAPVYAIQQQDQDKQQQDDKKQQDKDKKQQDPSKQQEQDQNKQQQRVQQRQQDQNRQQQQRVQQQQTAWQQHRARNWQSEHQTWQQRGGYNGDRIPEDRYRGNFGPDHSFRIYSNPVVVAGGYPGFLYGGFYFSVVDPWPQYW